MHLFDHNFLFLPPPFRKLSFFSSLVALLSILAKWNAAQFMNCIIKPMRSLRFTWLCYLTLTELSSRLKISDCLLQTHYTAALAPVPLWTQLPSPSRGHMHFCKTVRWTSWSTQSLPYSKNATERNGSSAWLWGKLVSREELDYISCPNPRCEMCSLKSTSSPI